LALGPDDQDDELDDEVSSINQGDDAALGAMYGEDGTEQMEKMVHKMQLKRAHLQMLVLQPVPLPKPSFKLCLVRDQALEDLLHQLPPLTNRRSCPRVNSDEPLFNEVA
jgi:hypothetical protein